MEEKLQKKMLLKKHCLVSDKINIIYNKFLDNSLYMIIPFFIALDSSILFISIMSIMVFYRLIRVIKNRTQYSKK